MYIYNTYLSRAAALVPIGYLIKKWHMPFFSETLTNIYEERSQTRLTLLIIKLYAPHPAGGIFTLRPIIRPGQTTRGKL